MQTDKGTAKFLFGNSTNMTCVQSGTHRIVKDYQLIKENDQNF